MAFWICRSVDTRAGRRCLWPFFGLRALCCLMTKIAAEKEPTAAVLPPAAFSVMRPLRASTVVPTGSEAAPLSGMNPQPRRRCPAT